MLLNDLPGWPYCRGVFTSCRWVLVALLVVMTVAALNGAARAQTDQNRSRTGRHQPVPVPKPESGPEQQAVLAGTLSGWFAGVGAGMTGGGDLWRVETVNEVPVPWQSAVPFTSSRFNATLANNAGGGLFVGRQLGGLWSVRLDLNSARMDITAEAPQGQQANVFGYDRLTITTVGLSAEVKLARIASAPYVTLGLVVNRVGAAREVELNQTQMGYRIGLGYLRTLTPKLGLRLEARYSRSGFDTGSFVPRIEAPIQPELEFAPADDLNLFELLLAGQVNF